MAQRLRNIIQGTLKLVRKFEEELANYNADVLSNDEIRKLEIMTTTLAKHKANIAERYEQLLEDAEDDNIENIIAEAAEKDLIVAEVLEKTKILIEANSVPADQGIINATSVTNIQQEVKLPQMSLPRFNGELSQFLAFWDCFKIVHENDKLADSVKFNYLMGQLDDSAKECLTGFTLTNANYEHAVKVLIERYGKPQRVKSALYDELIDLPEATEHIQSIEKFYRRIEVTIRQVDALKINMKEHEELSRFIAHLLLRKLPSTTKDNMFRRTNSDEMWTVDQLREQLKLEIDHRERTNTVQQGNRKKFMEGSNSGSHKNMNKKQVHNNSDEKRASAYIASATSKYPCRLCNQDHKVLQCSTYSTVYQRNERVKELQLCRKCLFPGHYAWNCKLERNCSTCGGANHHSAICYKKRNGNKGKYEDRAGKQNFARDGRTGKEVNTQRGTPEANTLNTGEILKPTVTTAASTARNVSAGARKHVALPTAVLQVYNKKRIMVARALFDAGSQRTFVLRETIERLNIQAYATERITIDSFNSNGQSQLYNKVKINVKTNSGMITIEAIVMDNLPNRVMMPEIKTIATRLTEVGIKIADSYDNDTIDLLIGADFYYEFVENPTMGGVHVLQSKVGVMFTGPYEACSDYDDRTHANVVTALQVCAAPTKDINFLWDLETIGINRRESHPDDEAALEQFERSIRFENGQYIAKLPWKAGHAPLPTNYGLAKGRLQNTMNKLRKDPVKLKQYEDVIKDQLENKFIEKVSEPLANTDRTVHYLSHHAVYKDSVTTPIRLVFDCSAKTGRGGMSLNDALYCGPSLLPELTKVLLRFRLNEFAITADIKKAFLMIGIDEEDRDCTRFLFPKNPFVADGPIQTYRFTSVLFGATCSPFILNATIRHHLNRFDEDKQLVDNIVRNLYVDNLSLTGQSEETMIQYYEKASNMMASAGLQLRSWVTNSSTTASHISGCDDLDDREYVPLLGLQWQVKEDRIALSPRNISDELPTKRKVLSSLASIFDPLGLFGPITVRGKLFMQTLWQMKLSWDEALSVELAAEWKTIAAQLKLLSQVSFPRQIYENGSATLHAFADASTIAYGTAIYVVQQRTSQLAIAKTRVAPQKELTVAKLELTAILLATRMICYVTSALQEDLRFESVHIWSDSQVALGWIQSNQQLNTYVQNRVREIHSNVPQALFHYVGTKENPADLLSRGTTIGKLTKNDKWFAGPDWLTGELPDPLPKQAKHAELSAESSTAASVVTDRSDSIVSRILQRVSSFAKAVHIMAAVKECVAAWKERRTCSLTAQTGMSVDKLNESKNTIIKGVQAEVFSDVITYIQEPKNKRKPCLLNTLNVELKGNILVCRTRITAANVSDAMKFPILLPSKHPLTELVIMATHEEQLHAGVSATLASVRENYWILKGRQRVKTIISRCVCCRRQQGNAYTSPPVPALPAIRVRESRPFATTGVDYAGPVFVKSSEPVKRYIALFTCAVTRAVHLELATDLSVSAFLQVFHRFVSRRSYPSVIISDNAKNFIGSAEVLKSWGEDPRFRNEMTLKGCRWINIPGRAPSFGGFYERMIKMTKMSLRKMLGRSRVSDEELHTLLCRIEARLNDRPLTYVSDQPDDESPLTPSMLMVGFRLDSISPPVDLNDDEDFGATQAQLTRRQQHNEVILTHYWNRWKSEYLAMLKMTCGNSTTGYYPTVDDVVLIHDEGSRLWWRLGRIVQLLKGKDDIVRVAQVRTNNGVITRAITKLYPLEIREEAHQRWPVAPPSATIRPSYDIPMRVSQNPSTIEETGSGASETVNDNSSGVSDTTAGKEIMGTNWSESGRPLRKAAAAARQRLKKLSE